LARLQAAVAVPPDPKDALELERAVRAFWAKGGQKGVMIGLCDIWDEALEERGGE
jgi:hypothetical protein